MVVLCSLINCAEKPLHMGSPLLFLCRFLLPYTVELGDMAKCDITVILLWVLFPCVNYLTTFIIFIWLFVCFSSTVVKMDVFSNSLGQLILSRAVKAKWEQCMLPTFSFYFVWDIKLQTIGPSIHPSFYPSILDWLLVCGRQQDWEGNPDVFVQEYQCVLRVCPGPLRRATHLVNLHRETSRGILIRCSSTYL